MSSGDYEIVVKCVRCSKMTPIGDIPHICSACGEKEPDYPSKGGSFPVSFQRCVGDKHEGGVRHTLAFEANTKVVIKCNGCGHYHGVHTSYTSSGQMFLEIMPCPRCLKELYAAQEEKDAQLPCASEQISNIIDSRGDSLSADAIVTLIDELLSVRTDDFVDDKVLAVIGRAYEELSKSSWARSSARALLNNHFSDSEITADEALAEIKNILKAARSDK